jgi:hypothetical protein
VSRPHTAGNVPQAERSDWHVRDRHMWEPDAASLKQLVALLEQTQQPSADQRQLLEQLDAHKGNADFNNYLAYLFAHAHDASEVVRVFYISYFFLLG